MDPNPLRAIRVEHRDGDLFEIAVRQHVLGVDQPVDNGGSDLAATPTELFVVSLASCVGFYVRRYLDRHALSAEGLVVLATYTMADRPARVGTIALAITLAHPVPDDRRAALLAVATHCTVHNSFAQPPAVTIDLDLDGSRSQPWPAGDRGGSP